MLLSRLNLFQFRNISSFSWEPHDRANLLVGANALIVFLGGYQGAWTWVVVITYFTVCHASLVLLGILGLAKAMAGQGWRFPLLGRPLPAGCPGGTSP